MRLKSYLLVTSITAAALFGATPAFADETPAPSAVAPSPGEGAPGESAPSPGEGAPVEPTVDPAEEEECWALIEDLEESGAPLDSVELSDLCADIAAEWEAEQAEREAEEAQSEDPWATAPPAQPQPADPNYTG